MNNDINVGLVNYNGLGVPLSNSLGKQADLKVKVHPGEDGYRYLLASKCKQPIVEDLKSLVEESDVIIDLSEGKSLKENMKIYGKNGVSLITTNGQGTPFESLSHYEMDSKDSHWRVLDGITIGVMQVIHPLYSLPENNGLFLKHPRVKGAMVCLQGDVTGIKSELENMLVDFDFLFPAPNGNSEPLYRIFIDPLKGDKWDTTDSLNILWGSKRIADITAFGPRGGREGIYTFEGLNKFAAGYMESGHGRILEIPIVSTHCGLTIGIDPYGPVILQISDLVRATQGVEQEEAIRKTNKYLDVGSLFE